MLVGANGAGKTNLLEAVSLLAPGQGLRRASYPDLARAAATAAGRSPPACTHAMAPSTSAPA